MTRDWYYGTNGERHGPVGLDELQQFVASGDVKVTDLAWTDGFYDWQPVADIAELKRPDASEITPPPLARQNRQTASQVDQRPRTKRDLSKWKHRAVQWWTELRSNAQAAGQLVAKQAERTKLATVTLPSAYRELGNHVYEDGKLQGGLTSDFETIDGLLKQIAQLAEMPAASESPQGVSEKAKGIAASTKRTAHKKITEQKLAQAYTALGRAAFEQQGEKSGSAELVAKVNECRSRIETLDGEIAEFGKEKLAVSKRTEVGKAMSSERLKAYVLPMLFLFAGICTFLPWETEIRPSGVKEGDPLVVPLIGLQQLSGQLLFALAVIGLVLSFDIIPRIAKHRRFTQGVTALLGTTVCFLSQYQGNLPLAGLWICLLLLACTTTWAFTHSETNPIHATYEWVAVTLVFAGVLVPWYSIEYRTYQQAVREFSISTGGTGLIESSDRADQVWKERPKSPDVKGYATHEIIGGRRVRLWGFAGAMYGFQTWTGWFVLVFALANTVVLVAPRLIIGTEKRFRQISGLVICAALLVFAMLSPHSNFEPFLYQGLSPFFIVPMGGAVLLGLAPRL